MVMFLLRPEVLMSSRCPLSLTMTFQPIGKTISTGKNTNKSATLQICLTKVYHVNCSWVNCSVKQSNEIIFVNICWVILNQIMVIMLAIQNAQCFQTLHGWPFKHIWHGHLDFVNFKSLSCMTWIKTHLPHAAVCLLSGLVGVVVLAGRE